MHPVVIAGTGIKKRGKQEQQQTFGILDPS